MSSEQIRVGQCSDVEKQIIGALTLEERRDILVRAAIDKMYKLLLGMGELAVESRPIDTSSIPPYSSTPKTGY